MGERRGKSASGAHEAAAGSAALLAEQACTSDDQIRAEIQLIREKLAANEALLNESALRSGDTSDKQPVRAESVPDGNLGSASGCYVYGIIGGGGDLPHGDLTDAGIDPANPIHLVAHQDIQAVVSSVSLGEFGEEALESNLNSIEWLTAKVRNHQNVLDRLSAIRTVIPMRFCTIYCSEHRVQEMLAQHYDDFSSALVRLEGKQEWGVKVYCAPQVLSEKAAEISDVAKSLTSELAEKSEAAAYFVKKKIDDAVSAEAERITDEVVQDSHNRLWMRSWEAVVNPAQSRKVTRREEDMVLNGAYLVSRECTEAFETELDDLRKKYVGLGFSYELSGPWPPYSFASAVGREDPVDEPVCT